MSASEDELAELENEICPEQPEKRDDDNDDDVADTLDNEEENDDGIEEISIGEKDNPEDDPGDDEKEKLLSADDDKEELLTADDDKEELLTADDGSAVAVDGAGDTEENVTLDHYTNVTIYQSEKAVGRRKTTQDEDDAVMMVQQREKKKMFDGAKAVIKFLFSELGVLVLCVLYAVVGASYYISLELPLEEQKRLQKISISKDIEDRTNYITDASWIYIKDPRYNLSQEEYFEKMEDNIRKQTQFLIDAADNFQYSGQKDIESWEYDWTFQNTLLFTISIITTIGYGNITPDTHWAKLFTIPYALFGMGLFFILMAKVGDLSADGLKLIYSRLCCRPCRETRRQSEFPGKSLKKLKKQLRNDDVGSEEWMPTDEVSIPIVICLVIFLAYVVMGTALFHKVEGWELVTASYFCFITLTTIGFGDYYPVKSFEGSADDILSLLIQVAAITYCVIGVALIAMIISTMQENLQLKAEKMKNKINGDTKIRLDEVEVRRKYQRKEDGAFDFKRTVDQDEELGAGEDEDEDDTQSIRVSSRASTARSVATLAPDSDKSSVADFDKEGGEASEDEDEVGDVDEGVVAAVDDGTTLEEIEVQ